MFEEQFKSGDSVSISKHAQDCEHKKNGLFLERRQKMKQAFKLPGIETNTNPQNKGSVGISSFITSSFTLEIVTSNAVFLN